MKKILILASAVILSLGILGVSSSASAQGRAVNIYLIVPSAYNSNATTDQALAMIQKDLGSPTDAPCLQNWNSSDPSTWNCSVEGWYRHELGKVFDYNVTIVHVSWDQTALGGLDACGQGSVALYGIYYDLKQQHYNVSGRTLAVTMGGGGWAGHFSPADKVTENGFGQVGDWGAMELYNNRNACVPDWDYPNRGFSHELAGAMGEYVTAGYNEGGLFVGDVMSAHEKADLLKYSGAWLRQP